MWLCNTNSDSTYVMFKQLPLLVRKRSFYHHLHTTQIPSNFLNDDLFSPPPPPPYALYTFIPVPQ
ncbi:unnamed protein product [Fusarium fujikuroi]|nr:unnamed protein product [Fusarium fujikuroi]